jgi:signal transduction histidine kinase
MVSAAGGQGIMSGAAKRSDGELLAQLIHDIKNPLGVMVSFAEEIPSAADEDRAQFCDRLVANARRALQVLDDFALLADLRREGNRLHETECEWDALIAEAVRDAAAATPAVAEVSGSAGSRPIRGDPHRLRQAISALLRETLHRARRDDHVRLRIDADETSVALHVTVSGGGDTEPSGYPFDEETVAFELVRRVAKAHRGSLRFATRGEEAVATLRVPRRHAREG